MTFIALNLHQKMDSKAQPRNTTKEFIVQRHRRGVRTTETIEETIDDICKSNVEEVKLIK